MTDVDVNIEAFKVCKADAINKFSKDDNGNFGKAIGLTDEWYEENKERHRKFIVELLKRDSFSEGYKVALQTANDLTEFMFFLFSLYITREHDCSHRSHVIIIQGR